MAKKEKWISLVERKPTEGRSKRQWQVYRNSGLQACAFWNGKYFSVGGMALNDVTHWMPLPKPPHW